MVYWFRPFPTLVHCRRSGILEFIYGPGIDEPICMIVVNGGETKYYYHFDGLGSVVALSDETGYIVERYSYDVFGGPDVTSSVGNPYMFTGRNYDSETGLYYYRVRYYKPSIGRFLQTDPIRYMAGMNLYKYVDNSPVVLIDPMGLLSVAFYDIDEPHFRTAAHFEVGKEHSYPMDINFDQAAGRFKNLEAPITHLYMFSHSHNYMEWGNTRILPGEATNAWTQIGNAMAPEGRIHLMGCYLGIEGFSPYVQEIANLTGKTVIVYTGTVTYAAWYDLLTGMPPYWYSKGVVNERGPDPIEPAFVIVRPEVRPSKKPCK